MDPKNNNSNIPSPSSNELPDLTPQNSALPSSSPNTQILETSPLPQTPIQPEVFVNPSPPLAPRDTQAFSNNVAANNPYIEGSVNESIGYANQPGADSPSGFSHFNLPGFGVNKKIILVIVGVVLVLGVGGFFLNEFVLNRISILKLVSEDAQFYLSLSVKKNPQAEATKNLLKKFPNGEKLVNEFNKYYASFIGNQKDPLLDIAAYANSEIFLTQVSRSSESTSGLNKLLNIVDVGDSKTARDDVSNFEEDTKNYTTTTSTYKGNHITEIKLKAEQKIYEDTLKQSSRYSLSYQLSTPKPLSLHATAIDRFLVAARDRNDLTKAIDLSQTKKTFGFGNSKDPKSILDSTDHQQIYQFFPDQTFLKFFQRQPLTISTSGGLTGPVVSTEANSDTEAKTFQKQSIGVDVVASENGAKIDSYALDWFSPKEDLTNGFKISESLATQLPKTYAGVSPTLYAETKDLKSQWEAEKKKNEALADSKNRTQRKQFEDYNTSLETGKNLFKKAYGIDYEKDLLDWMDGSVATIFNAGSSKKGPEFLIAAEIKNKTNVETSLKKLSVPDYSLTTRDATRKSDILDLQDSLSSYYDTNSLYPNKFSDLKKNDQYVRIPTDPKTGNDYAYTVSITKKGYTLSADMEDGTTLVVNETSFSPSFTGIKKDTTARPTGTDYQGSKIYKLKLYEYATIVYSLYFVVTDKKAIIAASDSDQALKDIINAEKNGGETLSQNAAWKKQFSGINDKVGSISFVEPIQFLGFMDYLSTQYPDYKKTASAYSGTSTSWDDMEIVAKAYLKTISSVGTVSKKTKPVFITNTFVNIVELPSNEKQKAEDALDRLMKTDETTNYKSVLGVSTVDLGSKFQKDWGKFEQIYLEPFIHPNF